MLRFLIIATEVEVDGSRLGLRLLLRSTTLSLLFNLLLEVVNQRMLVELGALRNGLPLRQRLARNLVQFSLSGVLHETDPKYE